MHLNPPHIANSRPNYPAVLDEQQVAECLGFNRREIKALLKSGHLRALGKGRKRTQKRFAAVAIFALVQDIEWLSTARDIICAHWRRTNAGKRKPLPLSSPSAETPTSRSLLNREQLKPQLSSEETPC